MFKPYRVSDINPGRLSSNPLRLTAVGDNLLFRAWNPGTGFEIWKSDGTTVGTVLVKDIHPTPYGFNNPAEFFVIGDVLCFSLLTVAVAESSGKQTVQLQVPCEWQISSRAKMAPGPAT